MEALRAALYSPPLAGGKRLHGVKASMALRAALSAQHPTVAPGAAACTPARAGGRPWRP